jgi:hypothetical protein
MNKKCVNETQRNQITAASTSYLEYVKDKVKTKASSKISAISREK